MRSMICASKLLLVLLLVSWQGSSAFGDDAATYSKLIDQFDTLSAAGKIDQADKVGKQALSLAEKMKNGPYIVSALERLSAMYRRAGRYADAEPFNKRALELEAKFSGTDSLDYAEALTCRANLLSDQGKLDDSLPLFKRALAIREKRLKPDDRDIATSLNNVASIYKDQAKYAEAEPLFKRALAIWEKAAAANDTNLTTSFVSVGLTNLARLYVEQSKYAEAEPLYKRALALEEKHLGPTDVRVADDLNNLAELESRQGKYDEAAALYTRSLKILEKQLGPDHPNVATVLNNLAVTYYKQAKYSEAEKLNARALAIREKKLGPDHIDLADTLNNLAGLESELGKYAEAEQYFQRSLTIYEKNLGADHPSLAVTLGSLASLYVSEGKYAEAEPLLKRALSISEKRLGPNHLNVALALYNLAVLYHTQGKNAEAELLYKRALEIYEKKLGPNHPDVADVLSQLAHLYANQGAYAEAEPLYTRAREIYEKQLGPDHPQVANVLNSLALLYNDQGDAAKSESLYKRSIAINEQYFGKENLEVATNLGNLSLVYMSLGKYDEAESLLKRSIAIVEKRLGSNHPGLATELINLADAKSGQDHDSEAEPFLDRAIEILEATKTAPDQLLGAYEKRATIAWKAGRRDEAIADERRAIDLAEQIRGEGAGTEQDRAKLFGRFSAAFETMLGWQIELGAGGEALAVLERGRSRSLLDELAMSGRDLSAGRSTAERDALAKKKADLHQQIASLEKQVSLATDADQKKRLEAKLADGREALVKFHQDEKAGSPVYRSLLSVGASSVRLSQLQRKLLSDGGRLWAYWIGENDSYLLVVTKDKVTSYKLSLTVETAISLGVKVGALTSEDLSKILAGERQSGLLFQLKNPKPDRTTVQKLNALWKLLVPEAEQKAALADDTKRIIVLPDGPLADLPFEALVIDDGDEPVYLLDQGPPILYAPSATVLYNLTERAGSKNNRDNKPVFTVGDPSYSGSGDSANSQNSSAPVSRYGELGGKLSPLPHTSTESAWIVQNFSKVGILANQLLKTKATEQNVRQNIAGRRLVHLACHGLVDQSYGNFFGALALTPGPRGNVDPSDDGFLTLPEIYDLDLKGTELAILSACETNLGPSQKGEGIWALSRGFMVAGSRRVVATDWLVDDEAAANLVSYLTAGIAKQEKSADGVDYAANLQAAKRWVRQQPKWSAPYYWAPFVMIGPK